MPKIGNINEEQFPDQIIVGSGPIAYAIPAGFNAVLEGTHGIEPLVVNGQEILASGSEVADTNVTIQVPNAAQGTYTYYTNNTGKDLSHTGDWEFHIIGPGLGIVMAWTVYVGSTIVGSGGQVFYTSPQTTNWSDIPLLQGETIRFVLSAYVNGGSGPWNTYLNGQGSTTPEANTSISTKLLPGDVISGGRYVIGLYAI
jgi:hypothetical protein